MDDVLATIGKIAAKPSRLVLWNSAFCMYDRFSDEDETDDTFAQAAELFDLLSAYIPERSYEIQRFRADYFALYASFEAEYRALPCAVFQADLNSSNVMIDSDHRFAGLIDFNMSGTEKVINYALCECWPGPSWEHELNTLMDADSLAQNIELLRRRLAVIGKYYAYTPAERRAFPTLFRLVAPFRYPTFVMFRWVLRNEKTEHYNRVLDWLMHQFYHADAHLPE